MHNENLSAHDSSSSDGHVAGDVALDHTGKFSFNMNLPLAQWSVCDSSSTNKWEGGDVAISFWQFLIYHLVNVVLKTSSNDENGTMELGLGLAVRSSKTATSLPINIGWSFTVCK